MVKTQAADISNIKNSEHLCIAEGGPGDSIPNLAELGQI